MRIVYFLSFIVSGFFTFAQSIEVSFNGDLLQNNQTIIINGDENQTSIKKDFDVTLNTAASKTIRMTRYEVTTLPSTFDYFCWSVCEIPAQVGTNPSWSDPSGVLLDNHTTQILSAYFVPNNQTGSAQYRYVLYDENNSSDSISLNIVFQSNPTSIKEVSFEDTNFELYPNPSSGKPNYKLTSSAATRDLNLRITNMIGEEVYVSSLHTIEKQSQLDLSGLETGLYFYSLSSTSGKVILTKRLIIK